MDDSMVAGGDAAYYYLGTCVISGNSASASVTITKHGSGVSIFGNLTSFKLALTGTVNGDQISLSGQVEQYPQMTMKATMRKLKRLS